MAFKFFRRWLATETLYFRRVDPEGRATGQEVSVRVSDATPDAIILGEGGGTEVDPIFTAHVSYNITSTQISHWESAYSWGNHSGLYVPVSHLNGHAPADAVSLATVKGDTEIASAISLKHSNSLDHSNALDHSNSLDHAQNTDTGTNSSTFSINGSNAIKEGDARLTDARDPKSHTQAETTITFTDVTTGNSSTVSHGFLPKLPTPSSGKFLKDDGTWDTPAGGSGLTHPQVLARTLGG